MKIFGLDLNKFFSNPTNVLIVGVVLLVIWNLYQHQEGFFAEKPTIVLYHLPGCRYCQDMMPEWDKFQKKHLSDANVVVKKIDCSEKPEAAKKNNIDGFPTVLKFKDGKKEVFKGERTAEALEGFLAQ